MIDKREKWTGMPLKRMLFYTVVTFVLLKNGIFSYKGVDSV
jgi:hypothetical protein